MGRPSKEELAEALAEAGRMREKNEDPHFVAKSLLNHEYRLKILEQLREAVEHYLHSGQSDIEHGRLMRVIEKIRSEDRHPGLDR